MKFSTSSILAIVALSAATQQSDAFSMQSHSLTSFGLQTASQPTAAMRSSPMMILSNTAITALQAATLDPASEQETEVQRLKAMAAKLRAEAAELEFQQASERTKFTEKIFQEFDANNDGDVTLDELKAALEHTFKMEIADERVEILMKDFDKSGDGKLQIDEMVSVEQFRNRLEYLARDEKREKSKATRSAAKSAEVSELIEAQLALINDRPPTGTDKAISVLPYLFPLMDGLLFGQFLLKDASNPVVGVVAAIYVLYRSIPFSGVLTFFGLSAGSNNLSLNRLVRYNMQQAIYLDFALFVPGVVGAITAAASSGLFGYQLPLGIAEIGSDVVFLTLLATLFYSTVSSLLGAEPNKIPLISDAVNKRLPSIDRSMFDSEGRFVPPQLEEKEDNDKEKKDETQE
mmetsp:Transcript_27688/g.31060  ORF Transcript_27688/g.31060 Transcript_27688/m.31060 type:complete len:404 (-) Transcript_27688:153-1364(-)|eukprot:CAMPEP_0170846266 /NCGR_PEP_ID=MMETSP0734-20130129/8045_1 /TAXON_ID=186038 /ORGANISM="Fragilariopsis kerguelensis, Strain L26-C5" /LENGTH=403 /DNA_ID=CAMNT_0011215181 /DNA_START=143 /DNA_END=1354 /DNA_ORIENTATION=+